MDPVNGACRRYKEESRNLWHIQALKIQRNRGCSPAFSNKIVGLQAVEAGSISCFLRG